jgi:N6-L-threonylcarbamoyladenine synthase
MDYREGALQKARALREKGAARILAIETSCDETAAAVVADGRRVLSGVVASQIDRHALFGGVVPEIASRMHVEAIDPLVAQALSRAGLYMEEIDAVAVTYGPGLVGALLTGVSWAKAFAYARALPLIAVNHIEGHVSANYLAHPALTPPFVCLVASGGHSHIIFVERYGAYRLLGRTMDDAAGEAFDKVARVLDIPYPGGPLLDELAESGDDAAYRFPAVRTQGAYDFSFSGLKTAVINQAHTLRQQGRQIDRAGFAASFRRAVVSMLVEKSVRAAVDAGAKRLAVAGGVAANLLLRRELTGAGQAAGLEVFLPPLRLCTDNAEMIGSAAFYRLMAGEIAPLSLNADPSARLEGLGGAPDRTGA